MNATLTDLRRQAGKVLAAVLHRNKTVKLTQHGKAVAEIRPRAQPMSPEEFGKLWRARRPLGKDTADEAASALKDHFKDIGAAAINPLAGRPSR